MEGAPPKRKSAGPEGRTAEFEFSRQAILEEENELGAIDAEIAILRPKHLAGDNTVSQRLTELRDRRGVLVSSKEKRERKP